MRFEPTRIEKDWLLRNEGAQCLEVIDSERGLPQHRE
jgi:hypothetical protein